jgi:hypothetical protein
VLDGMLEGAARLKTVLRVITNLVTLKWWVKSNYQPRYTEMVSKEWLPTSLHWNGE